MSKINEAAEVKETAAEVKETAAENKTDTAPAVNNDGRNGQTPQESVQKQEVQVRRSVGTVHGHIYSGGGSGKRNNHIAR